MDRRTFAQFALLLGSIRAGNQANLASGAEVRMDAVEHPVDGSPASIELGDSPAAHKFLVANNVKQHVVTAGSGEAVVLIHGWPLTWRSYARLIPLLAAQGYQVFAPDIRGFGDTAAVPPYEYGAAADDIFQLMQAFKVQRAHIVGHDLGAPVAYVLASRYPDLVRTLSILDVPFQGFGLEAFAQKLHLWHFDFLRWPGAAESLVPGRERAFFSFFYRTARKESITDENRELYLRAYERPQALKSTIGWYRDFREAGRYTLMECSRHLIQIPVLAVGGEYAGGSAPAECMRLLAGNVSGVEIAGIGHHIAEEAPRELARLLLEHFKRSS